MADLSITAANVIPGANAAIDRSAKAGAALAAGKVVYREAATGTYKLADSNSATAEAKTPTGIALHAAEIGQPVAVQTAGELSFGAILTAGSDYYLSETPGGIQPRADVASGELVSSLGYAKSTSVLVLKIQPTGVTL